MGTRLLHPCLGKGLLWVQHREPCPERLSLSEPLWVQTASLRSMAKASLGDTGSPLHSGTRGPSTRTPWQGPMGGCGRAVLFVSRRCLQLRLLACSHGDAHFAMATRGHPCW